MSIFFSLIKTDLGSSVICGRIPIVSGARSLILQRKCFMENLQSIKILKRDIVSNYS